MGRADRPKGLLKTDDRNLKVIPFIQDAPYYAQKGTYYSHKNKPAKALLYLQKAIEIEPDDPLNHYNLACLLSRINHLEEANSIFKHIVTNMDPELTECYFFMAVNHGLMEELPEAKRFLFKYLHLSPEGDMAEEAEDLLLAMEDEDNSETFNRSLSTADTEALIKLIEDMKKVQFKVRLLEEEYFFRVLQWGLYQGGDLLKESIIRLYGEAGCETACRQLVDFAANPWVNERLRQVALVELKKANPDGKCHIYKEGHFCEISLRNLPSPVPTWKSKWQQVLECTFANMKRSSYYTEEFYEDAEAIWLDFINQVYPQGPRVDSPQTWAAGLEYCLARFHFLGLTQKELAAAYGVSTTSVRRKFGEINNVLQIDRKAYHNMLSLLTNREGEQY
ncbi:MAG: tetratricopeptide repeat protein [Bacillota bacterium]